MSPMLFLAVPFGALVVAGAALSVRGLAPGQAVMPRSMAPFGCLCGAVLASVAAALLPPVLWPVATVLGAALAAIAWLDLVAGIVHALLVVPLAVAGAVFAWWSPDGDVTQSVLGGLLGYGLLRLAEWSFVALRGYPGLGRGDAWVLGALGSWVGVAGVGAVLALGALLALLGSAIAARGMPDPRRSLPFAPALALAGWCIWLLAASA